uniref:Serpentine Receptor, class T n=1 Tax=Steinernema glaseri TaxID=37863 RepID=A0A1I7YNU6_9BILA
MQVTIGMLYISIATLLPPINVRFIYIFLSRKHYRDMECYRIMALTGILQLFAGPGAFSCGLMQVLGSDPRGILLFFVILFSASIASEVVLNLVLALNRVKVILNIHTAPCLSKVIKTSDRMWQPLQLLIILACLYGLSYATALLSPYCGYLMVPGHYVGSYDFSKPYTQLFSKVNSLVLLTSSFLTFICYMLITVNLLWMRSKSTVTPNKEWSIAIYGGVRFTIDTSLSIAFFFMHLPPSPWSELVIGLTYILNQLFVSPLLYFTLTKNLRNEFLSLLRIQRRNHISTAIYRTSSHA